MLALKESIDYLAMANSVRWHGHASSRKDGHVFTKALSFDIEGQRKKRRTKRTLKNLAEEESIKVGVSVTDAL